MPYHNLYCSNEMGYRWHTVDDDKKKNNPILQLVITNLKEDITNILRHNKKLTPEMIIAMMDEYKPKILGIQAIHCPTCEKLQIDVIVNDRTKIREDLWRSYESDRYVKQFYKRGTNERR